MAEIDTKEAEARVQREQRALVKFVMAEETHRFLEENRAEITGRAEARLRKLSDLSLEEAIRQVTEAQP